MIGDGANGKMRGTIYLLDRESLRENEEIMEEYPVKQMKETMAKTYTERFAVFHCPSDKVTLYEAAIGSVGITNKQYEVEYKLGLAYFVFISKSLSQWEHFNMNILPMMMANHIITPEHLAELLEQNCGIPQLSIEV